MRFRKEPDVNLGQAARSVPEGGQARLEPDPRLGGGFVQESQKSMGNEMNSGNQALSEAVDGGDKFTIELDGTKSDDLIVGVEVNLSDKKTLLVERILNREWSLMYNWNVANPERQVKVGDRIIRVNHVVGSSIKMVNQCKMADGNRIITMDVVRQVAGAQSETISNRGAAKQAKSRTSSPEATQSEEQRRRAEAAATPPGQQFS